MESIVARNYRNASMMAKMDCWPHAIPLPVNRSLAAILRSGIQEANQSPVRKALSVRQLEAAILEARKKQTGFSYISMGDTECGFLAINQRVAEPYFRFGEMDFSMAGYDPNREQEERDSLLDAIRSASVVGVPIFRHGLIQAPLLHDLQQKGLDLDRLVWADSTVNYKLLESGALQRILTTGSPLVLCIGNEAQRLADYLVRQGVVVSGVLMPVRGMKDVSRIVENAARISYDIAVVAAGAASVPICARLAASQQKIALDIGKVADEWVTGISLFDGRINQEGLLHPDVYSEEQKAFSLDVQTGYQHGLNELIPDDLPLPLGQLPHHWVRTEWLRRRSGQEGDAACEVQSPVWLMQQIRHAFRHKRAFSFVAADAESIRQLEQRQPLSDPLFDETVSKINAIGIPYLDDHPTASSFAAAPRIFPRQGWVDTTALEQLQFDYFGRFLPDWLRGKRLLLVMEQPKQAAGFLRAHGYTVWGMIETRGRRDQVLSELSNAGDCDVVLVSAGIETFFYAPYIAEKWGTIALDVRNMLDDASRGVFNCVLWANGRVNKID